MNGGLRQAISDYRGSQGAARAEAASRLGHLAVETADDAEAVADLVADRRDGLFPSAADESPSFLFVAANLFQQVQSREAYDVLLADGLPVLREAFDAWLEGDVSADRRDDLVLVAKVFGLYRDEDDVPRVAAAARHAGVADAYLWSVVFATFDEQHPHAGELLERLREPLPDGFAGVTYLDFANRLAREASASHPFDTPAGQARLEALLADADPSRHSYAHSAAAALPFVSEPARGRLLALGLDHPSERVQLEAAWASAKLGSRAGIDLLARQCLDVRTSGVAVEYLEELGELNAIPARAKEPNFRAVAEMCRWLAHPMEFGRPPDEAEVYDCRVLDWPPVNERRRLWLVRYRYEASADRPEAAGLGLVGSITFALFGEATADLPPEDAYALHCCWELEVENDPRAPAERSAAAGREILRRHGNERF